MSDEMLDEISRVMMKHFEQNKRIIRNRMFGYPRVFKCKDQWYFAPSWPWTMPWDIRKAESWTGAVRLAVEHKSGRL
jgi:hypothetical protein